MSRGRSGRPTGSYWPHLGVVVGAGCNVAGLVLRDAGLLTTGTNLMMFFGAFILQRRANGKRDGE